MKVEIKIQENGCLLIQLDMTGRRELLEEMLAGESYWSTWASLIEDYACNGSFQHFDAGNGNPFVGLTSAPCIAENIDYQDNGDATIQGRLWAFNYYMIECDLQELVIHGEVNYHEVK